MSTLSPPGKPSQSPTAKQASYDDRVARLGPSEYAHVKDTIYLDHANTTPYSQTLIDQVSKDLKSSLLGSTLSPKLITDRVDSIRRHVLDYFKASHEHFDVVFVANSTAAIKLVMQSFQEHRFRYIYHKDACTSLVGVREVARAGSRCLESDLAVEDWLENGDASEKEGSHDGLRLFAYPAQSNMTGHRLPLSWAKRLRDSALRTHRKSFTLLDASSYLVTGRLDLSDAKAAADFIALSFDGMFGYPDLGALIVRKDAGRVLTLRRYFGSGTVGMVVDVGEQWHTKKETSIHESLEDGSLPVHSIFALEHAMKIQKNLFGTANDVSQHLSRISSWLHDEMAALRHFSGNPVVQMYKETSSSHADPTTQGAIIAFNVKDSNGNWIPNSQLEKLAVACNIRLGTGDFENPGGVATMLDLRPWEMIRNFYERLKLGDDLDIVGNAPTGVVRVSLGPMSTMADAKLFAAFIKLFFVQNKISNPKSPRGFVEFFETDLSEQADDYFGDETPVAEKQPLAIRPIQGCNVFHLAQVHETAEATEAAYSVWDRQWCIVNTSGLPLDPDTHAMDHLQVSVIPERGILKVVATRNFPQSRTVSSTSQPHLSGSTSHPVAPTRGNTLKIDLWSPPPKNENAVPSPDDGRIPDPYVPSEIMSYFSQALGVPCTLARYRPKTELSKIQRTCVVPRCRLQCSDPEALDKHYASTHAEEFEKERKKTEKKVRPPSLQNLGSAEKIPGLSPPTDGGGLGRSNSKLLSFSRANSKRRPQTPVPVPTPYSPVDAEPKRRSMDSAQPTREETQAVSGLLDPRNEAVQRSNSRKLLFRSRSKRSHTVTAASTAPSAAEVEPLPMPVANGAPRRSFERFLSPSLSGRRPKSSQGHDRAHSETAAPLISVEDTDGMIVLDNVDGDGDVYVNGNANGNRTAKMNTNMHMNGGSGLGAGLANGNNIGRSNTGREVKGGWLGRALSRRGK